MASDLLRKHHWKTFKDITFTNFVGSTFNDVESNNNNLHIMLVFVSRDKNFEYCELTKHLLQRLKDIYYT